MGATDTLYEYVFGKTGSKFLGALFTFIIFYYIFLQIKAELAPAMDDLRLALTLIMFVWILNWMRKLLGSARLALLFALVISYLVFFKHPNLLFTVFGLLFLVYFFKPFFEKATDAGAPPHIDIMNFYKDLAEKSKGGMTVIVSPPGTWPMYYIPMGYTMTSTQQNQGGERR